MAPKITAAIPLDPYVVRVVFENGEMRDVDIEPLLDGPVFQPLRDPQAFAAVRVSEYGDTIEWPSGADLDPDVLYGAERPSGDAAPRITTPAAG